MTYTLDRSELALALLIALATPLSACGGDAPDPLDPELAYLTIEGPAAVDIRAGGTERLRVRYHDGDDRPLAGPIAFQIEGDAGGSALSGAVAATGDDGTSSIELAADDAGTRFRVRASAAGAEPVDWTITVVQGELDPAGAFTLSSRFDALPALPGTAGSVVDMLLAMTDGPNDPASFVLDQIEDAVGGTTAALLAAVRPWIDALVNEALTAAAPQLVDRLLAAGDMVDEAAHHLVASSTLIIEPDGDAWRANHKITRFGFTLAGQTYTRSAAELGASPIDDGTLAVALAGDHLTLAEHGVPLPYGALLEVALEQVIVASVDPGAASLADLLVRAVDCPSIGVELDDATGLGASFFTEACEVGLSSAAGAVLGRLRQLDATTPVTLRVAGKARVVDRDGDLEIDTIERGAWSGTVEAGGEQVTIPTGSAFVGQRRPPVSARATRERTGG